MIKHFCTVTFLPYNRVVVGAGTDCMAHKDENIYCDPISYKSMKTQKAIATLKKLSLLEQTNTM